MLTSIRGLLAATIASGSILAATPALADETDPPPAVTVTGSVAFASDYRFRGLSQSDRKPVVQGSITVKHKSGFYVSAWGSSTAADFAKTPIAPGGTEIDVYGGWTGELGGSGITADAGVYGYLYPNESLNNYYEVYGSLAKTLGPVTAKAGVYYAPGQQYFKTYAVTNHNIYAYGELSGGIPGTPVSLHSHFGYTSGGLRYIKNYVDYSVGASVAWKNLTLDASLVGTNVSKSDVDLGFGCAALAACIDYGHRVAKAGAVVTLSASF